MKLTKEEIIYRLKKIREDITNDCISIKGLIDYKGNSEYLIRYLQGKYEVLQNQLHNINTLIVDSERNYK